MALKLTFTCRNCEALYELVRVKVGPESRDRQVTCRDCGAPFPGREGKFVLKYFLLRKATRIQEWGLRRRSGRCGCDFRQREPCCPYRPESAALSMPLVSQSAQGKAGPVSPRRFQRSRPLERLRRHIARTHLLPAWHILRGPRHRQLAYL